MAALDYGYAPEMGAVPTLEFKKTLDFGAGSGGGLVAHDVTFGSSGVLALTNGDALPDVDSIAPSVFRNQGSVLPSIEDFSPMPTLRAARAVHQNQPVCRSPSTTLPWRPRHASFRLGSSTRISEHAVYASGEPNRQGRAEPERGGHG